MSQNAKFAFCDIIYFFITYFCIQNKTIHIIVSFNSNIMKRKNYICLFLALGLIFFGSCKQIEKASTITVSVPDFTVNIPVTVSALRAAGDFKNFSGSATIDISDPKFADLAKYKDMITSVKVGLATMTMTASTGTTVQSATVSATGITPDFTIGSYTIGTEYSSPELVSYSNKVFNQFIKAGNINVSVSGQTDIDETTGQMTVSLHFGNIQVKAQLINL